jgi:hypothetical protein
MTPAALIRNVATGSGSYIGTVGAQRAVAVLAEAGLLVGEAERAVIDDPPRVGDIFEWDDANWGRCRVVTVYPNGNVYWASIDDTVIAHSTASAADFTAHARILTTEAVPDPTVDIVAVDTGDGVEYVAVGS